MIIPVQFAGRALPKEIKEKIKKREYNVKDLNDIYKGILKSESDNNINFITNAVIFFIVFAFLSYKIIKSSDDEIIFGLAFGIIFYSIIMAFFFWMKKLEKRQFLKLIKEYYIKDYDNIVNVNLTDSNVNIDNSYYGGFVISKNITRNGAKVKWIAKIQPSISQYNGWNIYSEIDNQEFISNPSNFEIVSADTILKFVPEILKVYNAPYGTYLTLKYNNGAFIGFMNTKTGQDVSLNEILKQ